MTSHHDIRPAARIKARAIPQQLIGGRPGLTSRQIAASLGWQHKLVHQSLTYRGFASQLRSAGYHISSFEEKTGRRGRPTKVWVLELDAAKIFVAQTRTDAGFEYLRYLLECERVAEVVAPRMVEEIARLRAENDALRAPRRGRRKSRAFVDVLLHTLKLTDLFGAAHSQPVWERRYYDELEPAELRAYRVQHRARTMRGLATVQDADINPARLLEAAPRPTH